jgi:tRNA threonylcarbamoyladenosine biosynthesis protein TsaE
VKQKEYFLADEAATLAMGKSLAADLKPGMTVFLEGSLGAGKTTLCRGILQFYGHSGTVKSPTYTLVEPYEKLVTPVYHFDLYRLGNGEELEYIGIRDYFSGANLCLVEWAERAEGYLPKPDLVITLVPIIKFGQHGRKLLVS